MGTVCASCGESLPAGARFCPSCGTPVALAETRPTPPEERRVVTILFADIVGFTARSDRADPEDVRRTLLPFHTRVKEDIERFGGVLDKFIGDAAMGVFGAPVAHEDDPERAVGAALRILDAIARLNEEDPSLDLSVRIGVNTGEAVVAFASGPIVGENVAGDVVNTASRLQGVAPPGSIVIGEATLRATRGIFDVEALEPVTVKGKAQPLGVWLVHGSLAVAEESSTPFIGREEELALLVGTFERAQHLSSLQLVTVLGEPGIGKSRLLRELRDRLASRSDGPAWFQGRSSAPAGAGSRSGPPRTPSPR